MTAVVSNPRRDGWVRTLCSGRPHQVVDSDAGPYLHRWFLIPHNGRLNVYLHKFVRSDDPGPLHDHPWAFLSIILSSGGYREVTEAGDVLRRRGSVAWRRAAHRHRVELLRDRHGGELPCWTIIVTGARRRAWGFWCPLPGGRKRFVGWQDFGAGGCGEITDSPSPVGDPRDS
ncbi:hypothetical protein [[Mycobacterium] nativiensis]|uniref:Cysteine dioxygenase n=1 Tax=[Mycobacterium] nativiensis TaxID=2855503 RepID=A0ABU5XV24_9MYCO|nr:hypothetical protein [Mycolicibacter sp. MYC340]MEB3031788.1 hypothetical protein [Mycolicibacter sp. MYC340]